ERFHVPVEHRSVCVNPASVDLLGKLEPSFARRLMCADFPAFRFPKYLGPASGAAIHPGGLQPRDDFLIAHPAGSNEVIELDHCEGLQVHVGEVALQLAEQGSVVIELEPGVQSSDDMEFARAVLICGPRYLNALFDRPFVGFRMPNPAIKTAEGTIGDADICVVQMPVDVVVGEISVDALAYQVRE